MNRKKKRLYVLIITILVLLLCYKLLIQSGVLASVYVFMLCQCDRHIIADFLKLPVLGMSKSFEKPLIEALRYEKNANAYYTLLAIDPPPLEALRKAMKNKNPRIRKEAASLLREFKDLSSYDVLVSALNDPDEEVQYEAIMALREIGDKRAYSYIVKKFDHENQNIRIASIYAIKTLRTDDKEIYLFLEKALSDPVPIVRYEAIENLGSLKTAKAFKLVGLVLKDPNRENRMFALRILSNSNDKITIFQLKEFLKSSRDEEEKKKALDSLKWIENNKQVVDVKK